MVVILGKAIISGDMKFVAGEGMPILDDSSGAKGNLIIKFTVRIPEIGSAGKSIAFHENGILSAGLPTLEAHLLEDFAIVENSKDGKDTGDGQGLSQTGTALPEEGIYGAAEDSDALSQTGNGLAQNEEVLPRDGKALPRSLCNKRIDADDKASDDSD